MSSRFGLRVVAAFELAKGAIVLFAGFGLLSLLHHDLKHLAERLVGLLHLDPGGRYPHYFLELADHTTDARLWIFSGFACAYAALRIAEGYGLWRARRWAEWLAVASGGLYMPFEIYELVHGVTLTKAIAFGVNAAVVAYMGIMLWRAKIGESAAS